jgi:acetoin utilization protein AcuB
MSDRDISTTPWAPVRVEQIMSPRLYSVPADARLAQARDLMDQFHVHHLLVEDSGRFVGLISDRDVLSNLSPYVGTVASKRRDDDTLTRPVYRFATYELITIPAGAVVEEAARKLLEHKISCLPVVNHLDEIIGIVTKSDLLFGMLSCIVPVDGGERPSEAA